MRRDAGQTVIETAAFLCAVWALIGAFLVFNQWFVIHQRLHLAARQAALLYSSGRHHPAEVRSHVRQFLNRGRPRLPPSRVQVHLGRQPGVVGRFHRLDEIRVQYRPAGRLLAAIQPVMEEKCLIRHSPQDGPILPGFYGPPVPW